MKRIILLSMVIALASMISYSCSKKEAEINPAGHEVSDLVKSRVEALGFSSDEMTTTEGGYIVEGDIFLSYDAIQASAVPDLHSLLVGDAEQYNTTYLVTGLPRTIRMYVNLSGGQALPASYGNALDEVVARYNAENLQLNFVRVYTAAEGDIDFVKANGSYLASAGFPTSAGNPYGTVKVNSNAIGNGTSTTFINYVATIMAHEAGHCIGFRHTDYMDRSYSCGGATSNEGASTVGAIHIPGTPTGPDPNSWMLACIGANQNRPFNANDKTALNYLY